MSPSPPASDKSHSGRARDSKRVSCSNFAKSTGERPSQVADCWPTRAPISEYKSSEAIFPIPPLKHDRLQVGESVTARRRKSRREKVFCVGNECLDALNEIYGCDEPDLKTCTDRKVLPCHQAIHRHVIS